LNIVGGENDEVVIAEIIMMKILVLSAGFLALGGSAFGQQPQPSESASGQPKVEKSRPENLRDPRYNLPFGRPSLSTAARHEMLKAGAVVSVMGLKPGATVVDIGAGGGIFTFPLADALHGTGQVFATEIAEKIISYLKDKARAEGYTNVTALAVNRVGLDPFYKQHVFDHIVVCGLLPDLFKPAAYFSELAPSLKAQTGRLWLITPKIDPEFAEVEFGDFQGALKTLKDKPQAAPVLLRLRPQLQAFLKDWREEQSIPAEVRKSLVEDLNAMLHEPRLYPELKDAYPPGDTTLTEGQDRIVAKEDMPLFQWLGSLLEEAGAWSSHMDSLTPEAKRNLHRMNRILLAGLLDTRTWTTVTSLEFHYIPLPQTLIRDFKTWGYDLVKDHDELLNYFDVLEFRRAS
jgi:2-polyprenyl-3-methyl-5-hydroxy-6-metoxy-1,4-benzoquinol methylase